MLYRTSNFGFRFLSILALLAAGSARVGTAASIVVSVDGYKQQFKGAGCQSTLYGNEFGGLSSTEQGWYLDWVFCDLNMGYLRDNRYTTEGLARGANLKLHAYMSVSSDLEVNGDLNIADPQVYNKLATNWFNHLQSQHAAGQDVNIARLLNEPDYEESNNSGALGYPGNPQKGFALIIDRAVGRMVDMLADPNINTTGIPRPLIMFPNTLDAGQCVSYLTEIKKSTYPRGWGLVNIVSTHQYGNGVSTSTFNSIASAAAGRRMIMSEMYPNRGDSLGTLPVDTETRAVLSLAQLISVPVNAGFDSWWYWQINYDGETAMAILTVPWGSVSRPKHYWGLRQLTSLVPYNANVLIPTLSGLGSVSVMAMRLSGDSHVTLNVANNEGSTKSASIQLKNAGAVITPYAYYQYLTDTNNDMVVSGPVLVTAGASTFTVPLRPYSLTSLVVLLSAPPGAPAALAHWSLDDATGSVAADFSGHGYNAALGVNNVWTNGMINACLQYPADYSPTTASYSLGNVTQMTYSAWFNRGAPSGSQYLGGSTGTNAWSVFHYPSTDALRVSIGGDNWDTTVNATSNDWHHLVLTVDVPTSTVHLYLDGALRASTTRSAMSALTLGSLYWGARVNGLMDDVWLFNSVLTQSQVEGLHMAYIPIAPPSPAATTTSLATSVNPSAAGSPITFTATVRTNGVTLLGAQGTIVFKDNNSPLSTNTPFGGVTTFTTSALGLGSHPIRADYSGVSQFYVPSVSATVTQVVATSTATTTALAGSPNPSATGGNVTFSATVRVGGATATGAGGNIVFKDNTTALRTNALSGGMATYSTSALAYGSHLIKAEYAGSGIYLASTSAPLAQLVLNATATTTALTASPNPSVVGGDVTLTATITPSVAAGTVVFKDGGTPLSTNAVSGSAASFTASALAPGSHPLTVEYSGYGPYLASTNAPALTQAVVKVATATVLGASPNPSAVGSNVTITATVQAGGATAVGAGGTIIFKDNSTPLRTNAVSGGVASFTTSALAYGSHLMTVEYSGDSLYQASTSTPLAQIVTTPSPTTTVLGAFPNPSVEGSDVTFTATVQSGGAAATSAGGTMVFKDGGTPLSTNTVFGGMAAFDTSALPLGSHSMRAEYSGDVVNLPSISAPLSQLVQPPIPTTPRNLTWSVSDGSLTLSWPVEYLGWILQAQTNSTGLDADWADLPGTTLVTSTKLPIFLGNLPVFYRLWYPTP